MSDLDGETAVVTGGATGIGRAIAERLGADGARVVVLDVQDGGEAVAAVEAAGGAAEFRETDVTDPDTLRAAFEGLSADVLVNNAAYYAPLVGDKKRFDEITAEEWDTVTDVNVKGVFLASKHALPGMGAGSRVVNVSSSTVLKGTPGFLHYVASKAAVVGMTRAMANEVGDLGIRVNAVAPGFTASEASRQAGEEYLADRREGQALPHRSIEPEDIADGVAFLAGPDSEMVTGELLVVNAGASMH